MALTRNNIAYNLKESPYDVVVQSYSQEMKFVFSSEMNKERFINRIRDSREKIESSLTNRFKFKVINDIIADIVLYKSIEKRGFLIIVDGKEITCLQSITLDGDKVILTN